MYIETVDFEDFNGEPRKKDVSFHLSFMEIINKDKQFDDDLTYFQHLQASTNEARIAGDTARLAELYFKLMAESYGTFTQDGRRFVRAENPRKDLMQLAELDELLQGLVADKTRADAFIDGVLN